MTAQDDQNFYEKKERLLHRVEAGKATQAEKEWLIRWGFLEIPKPPPLKTTYDTPTKTGKAYRYRGPMKATPVARVGGSPPPKTPTSRKNRPKRRSVWAKSQTMR
jgi:hypothetical protein